MSEEANSAVQVVLASEGTYPFSSGGVGTWCHQLCDGLHDVDFTLLSVTATSESRWHYVRPQSIRRVVQVPMWPGEEPAIFLQTGPYSRVMRRRWATSPSRVASEFVPPLRVVLREVFHGGVPIEALIDAFVEMGVYLRKFDYKSSMQARPTWHAFLDAIASFAPTTDADTEQTKIGDVITCARWFYNMMMPLAVTLDGTTVFHASCASPCALPGVVARRLEGTSFLLTEHGVYLRERYLAISETDFSPVTKRFLVGLAVAVARACYATADVIAPVASYNTRWEFPWGAPRDRVRVIHNGVDVERFRPAPPIRRSRPTAVAVAHVYPLKDIETMIRATDVLRRREPGARVVVYGALDKDVDYVSRCRALVRDLGLQDHFELAGPHSNPPTMFHAGDVSVLSSISEGFPYTVLESMASGVPCIATDVGGVREAIGDTGIVVPARDPHALGEALASLLTQHDRRRQLGERARARAVAEFTVSRQLERYRALYDELHEATIERESRGAA